MLTGKQKRYLRSVAHNLKPLFQIGKEGITANQIDAIDEYLERKELLKVKLLETCPISKNEAAIELSAQTNSDVVQILGRTIVLYRKSPEKIYKLP